MGYLVKSDGDVLVFGLSWFSSGESIVNDTNIPRVCFVHKKGVDWETKENFARQCELVLSSVPNLPIKYKLFGYAADPSVFHDRGLERVYDFGFSGALHNEENYPPGTFRVPNLRRDIQELLKESGFNCFLNGSDSIKQRILSYEKYATKLSESKIWLATTGPDADVGPRYYEVWASKALLFCDRVPGPYRRIFRNGYNCIEFADDLSDFLPKLKHYLENEEEREKIVNRAYRNFITNHTWSARAWDLVDICDKLVRNASL